MLGSKIETKMWKIHIQKDHPDKSSSMAKQKSAHHYQSTPVVCIMTIWRRLWVWVSMIWYDIQYSNIVIDDNIIFQNLFSPNTFRGSYFKLGGEGS